MINNRTLGMCTLAIVAAIGSATYPGTLAGVVMYLCAGAVVVMVMMWPEGFPATMTTTARVVALPLDRREVSLILKSLADRIAATDPAGRSDDMREAVREAAAEALELATLAHKIHAAAAKLDG